MPEKYADLWNLHDIYFLTETPRAILYTADYSGQKTVLKILKTLGLEHEKTGIDFLIICPPEIAVRILKSDNKAALLEYLPGSPLSDYVRQNRDDDATHIIAALAKKISTISIPKSNNFTKLEDWLSALFQKANEKDDENHTLYAAAASLARDLLDDDQTPSLLHGDLHHDNIIFGMDGLPKIIDPKGLIGDPAYEFANALRNPDLDSLVTKERIMRQSKIFSEISGLDQKRILGFGFVHSCISHIWAQIDCENSSLHIAKLFFEMRVS